MMASSNFGSRTSRGVGITRTGQVSGTFSVNDEGQHSVVVDCARE